MPTPDEAAAALYSPGDQLYGFPGNAPPSVLQIDAMARALLGQGHPGAAPLQATPRVPEAATGPVPQLPPIGQQVRDVLANPPGPGREMGDLFPHLYPAGDPNSYMTVQQIRQALDPSHVVARPPPAPQPQVDIGRMASAPAFGPVEQSIVPGPTVPGVRNFSNLSDNARDAYYASQPPAQNVMSRFGYSMSPTAEPGDYFIHEPSGNRIAELSRIDALAGSSPGPLHLQMLNSPFSRMVNSPEEGFNEALGLHGRMLTGPQPKSRTATQTER